MCMQVIPLFFVMFLGLFKNVDYEVMSQSYFPTLLLIAFKFSECCSHATTFVIPLLIDTLIFECTCQKIKGTMV